MATESASLRANRPTGSMSGLVTDLVRPYRGWLAMEVRDEHVIERLHKTAHHDWDNSHPLDLSDEGLLAELQKEEGAGAAKLVLDNGHEKHNKH